MPPTVMPLVYFPLKLRVPVAAIVPPLMVRALAPIALTPFATRVPEFKTNPPPNVPPDVRITPPTPVRLKPTVAPPDQAWESASKVLPLLTVIGLTTPAAPPSVPEAAVSVKFSVTLIPPTEIVAPVPVPLTMLKLAMLPVAKVSVKGPAFVGAHLAAFKALPSPAKN